MHTRLPRFSRRAWLLLLVVGAAFVAGVAASRFKPQAVRAYQSAARWWILKKFDPVREIARQRQLDSRTPREQRILDTTLLSLRIDNLRPAATRPLPPRHGGLALVGEHLVVVDRLGDFHVATGDTLQPLPLPPLSNRLAEFLKARGPDTSINLHVHDVEFVEAAGVLAVSYEIYDPARRAPHLAVSLLALNPATLQPVGAWRTVFEADPIFSEPFLGNGGGGRLAVRPGGKLLVSVGDYNQDGYTRAAPAFAQRTDSKLGKIYEIDCVTGSSRQISRGHRNAQGIVVMTSGEIYSTEHGPRGGDELNLILEGADYGWPSTTLGTAYRTYTWPAEEQVGRHHGFTAPRFAWVPSIAASQLIEVQHFDERWKGDLLVASLKAASLFRLRLEEGCFIASLSSSGVASVIWWKRSRARSSSGPMIPN